MLFEKSRIFETNFCTPIANLTLCKMCNKMHWGSISEDNTFHCRMRHKNRVESVTGFIIYNVIS